MSRTHAHRTEIDIIRVDNSEIDGAVPIQDYAHKEIHKGKAFFVKGWQDVDGADTVVNFLFVTGATTPHATWNVGGESEFTLELYEDTTVSANGTPVTVYNHKRDSSNTSTVSAYTGPTITGDGTKIWSGKIGSGRNATEERGASGELIAKTNSNYLFRITKNAANVHYFDYDFNWYEHTVDFGAD